MARSLRLCTAEALRVLRRREQPPAAVTMRRLNARWIAAGRRRIVARGLRAEGLTFEQIGAELGITGETARRDCMGMADTALIICAHAPKPVVAVRYELDSKGRYWWGCSWCGARVKVVA